MPIVVSDPEFGVSPTPTPGLVSILVLCCGQIEYTRLCVPSLMRPSRSPYEVIAVDAGARDGTTEYWAGVQAAASVQVGVVTAPADAALPNALRAGLDRARGEFVVLLNNDTIVPEGWLTQLTALIGMDAGLGMVAPMTTFGPGPQVVWPVPYQLGTRVGAGSSVGEIAAQVAAVDRFALEWREQHRGQWAEADRLGGGCVLLRRTALQVVGVPPGAPLQFFEAEALSRRVLAAGFRLACCRDLFVHSFGSRGFTARERG